MKCMYCKGELGTADVGGICRACKEKFKDAELFLYKREHTLRAKAEYELAIYKKAFSYASLII